MYKPLGFDRTDKSEAYCGCGHTPHRNGCEGCAADGVEWWHHPYWQYSQPIRNMIRKVMHRAYASMG